MFWRMGLLLRVSTILTKPDMQKAAAFIVAENLKFKKQLTPRLLRNVKVQEQIGENGEVVEEC